MLRGKPEEVLPRVWKDWQITRLCFEVDTEEYARDRDTKITAAAKEAGASGRTYNARACLFLCGRLAQRLPPSELTRSLRVLF